MSDLLKDAEHNRNLVMATDPTRSGPLTVRHKGGVDRIRPADLPKAGDLKYLVDVYLEGGDIVFRFEIPEGAPRTHRQITRHGVTRPVLVGSAEDLEASEA